MASNEPKTETNVQHTPSTPNLTSNASQVHKVGTEPKTETDVQHTPTTPNSTSKASKVHTANTEPKTETNVQHTPTTPKRTITVSKMKTVIVTNISMGVTQKDIWEFFSFSGDIHYIEMLRESETTQHAFVTFKDSQGADTAVLLTGATIADHSVSVSVIETYQLPPEALVPDKEPPDTQSNTRGEAVQKAEDMVSTMLAKGFVLGKDALKKAKSFDERHNLTSKTSATVASLDRKMGLSQKLSKGTAVVNEKMKEMDERYNVTESTKSAMAKAEQKASSAGSKLMTNPYVSSGATWVSGAFAAVAKAAGDVGSKTKEKVDKAEEEKKEAVYKERTNAVNDYAKFHVDESSIEDSRVKSSEGKDKISEVCVKSSDDKDKNSQAFVKSSDDKDKDSEVSAKSSDDKDKDKNSEVSVKSSDDKDKSSQVSVKSSDDKDKSSQALVIASDDKDKSSQVTIKSSDDKDKSSQACVKSSDDKDKSSQVSVKSSDDKDKSSQVSVKSSDDKDKSSQTSIKSADDKDKSSQVSVKSSDDKDKSS